MITTSEAAVRMGMSARHVRRLVESGCIKGQRIGRDWLIDPGSLNHYMRRRAPKKRKAICLTAQVRSG